MSFIATDIGGTFTDLVAYDPDANVLYQSKSYTDPADLTGGIARCLDKAGVGVATAREFVHGSTIAINTAIERKGSRVALLVTRGTRDVYGIGRGNRPEAYNLFFERPRPYVPRRLTFEIRERIGADGSVLAPIELEDVRTAVEAATAAGAEALAVCFLHSYSNPLHEQEARRTIAECAPELYVSVSHEILREYREYERTSTTVLNSYVGPRMSVYLTGIEQLLASREFGGRTLIMQSNGGVMAPATARHQPVRTMESGPVGGAIAAAQLADRLGIRQAVAFDMGGTTAKATLARDGQPEMSEGYFVGGPMSGHPVMLPVVDVIEVGAGGGSIAYLDEVGALHIGPESAGGRPGPICYGWGGTRPTVTDANAVLGRLGAQSFLGGEMPLDVERAKAALEDQVGRPLGLDAEAAARAVVDVAVNKMALAVRAVSIERGLDPRDCALIAFGGAGPLHACAIARDLSIPKVVVPLLPGHFSALGMLLADVRHDYVRTCYQRLDEMDLAELVKIFAEMRQEASDLLRAEEISADRAEYETYLDLRYAGQEFALRTPVRLADVAAGDHPRIRSDFDDLHLERFGHVARDEPVTVVNARLVGVGRRATVELNGITSADGRAEVTMRDVAFSAAHGTVRKQCPVHWRGALARGARIEGPAVIEEYASTILLDSGDVATVADEGEVVIDVQVR